MNQLIADMLFVVTLHLKMLINQFMTSIKQILLFLSVSVAVTSCGNSNADSTDESVVHNVFVISPEEIGASSERSFAAVVEEARTISTGFKTAGQIERILVDEGDYVRAGQLLAVLDTVDYALGVRQLRVQHAQMGDEMERRAKLYAAGSMSDNDYEKARAGYEQLGLQLALNENKLRYCRLYAPSSGYITKRNFEPAEMVDAGTPVFELMDNSHLEVVVDLPVSEYMRRENFIGFTGRTSLQPDDVFALNMMSLTPRADNNQLYQLRLSLPAGSHVSLTPGMNLTVDIATAGTDDRAVVLPARALFDRDGVSHVWVYEPESSTVRAVAVTATRGATDDTMLVTSGLTGNEQVVRAGVHHLTDGEKVNVIDEHSDTNIGNVL